MERQSSAVPVEGVAAGPTIRIAFEQGRLVVANDWWLEDPGEIRRALGPELADPAARARLRRLLAEEGSQLEVSRLQADDLLAAVARHLDPGAVVHGVAEPIRDVQAIEAGAAAGLPPAAGPAAGPSLKPMPVGAKELHIVLQHEDGLRIPEEPYRVIFADGSKNEGQLDIAGEAHFKGVAPGMCRVIFPRLDKGTWKKKA